MNEQDIKLLLVEIVKELTEEEIQELIKQLTFSNKLLSFSLLAKDHPRFAVGLC